MVGNLLQQLYNVVDTLIVGRYLGSNALGAVGSSYTLMTFLTSILLGLCMGSGVRFSICCGRRQEALLRRSMVLSFGFIALVSVALNIGGLSGTGRHHCPLAGAPGVPGTHGRVPLCDFLRHLGHIPL